MAIVSKGTMIPLQALAETSPVVSHGYFSATDGLALVDRWATYSAIYTSQPVLSGVIDKIADLTARLSLRVYDTSNQDAHEPDYTSPYAKLLANPCPYLDPYTFWTWWVTTYEIYGEVYCLKLRGADGVPQALIPMHPTRTLVRREDNGAEMFSFTMGAGANTGIIERGRDDVMLKRHYNPETPMRGMSRLQSLTRTIQNEDAARASMSATWQRGSQPMIALKSTAGARQTQMDALQAKLENNHAGPTKAGGIMLLPTGIEPVALQIDPQKMQFIESLTLTREEVLIRLDFPPPAAHILDHATFANITEQMRSMYRDSMAPRLESIESVLDFDLRPEFYPGGGRYAKFDLDEVLRGDFEVRADAISKMILNGTATPNEGRAMSGLSRHDDPAADKLYANQALQPLGTPVAGSTPPPTTPPQPPTDQQRAISGRLGRKVTKESSRDDRLAAYTDEFLTALSDSVNAQKAAALSEISGKALNWDVGAFDVPLTETLAATCRSVSLSAGRSIDPSYTLGNLNIDEEMGAAAHGINAVTMTSVNAATDSESVSAAFDARLAALAVTALTLASRWANTAELDSATSSFHLTKKTWVTGSNPRPSHAAMSGKTVPLRDPFPNGYRHPGEGPDSINCNCFLQYH